MSHFEFIRKGWLSGSEDSLRFYLSHTPRVYYKNWDIELTKMALITDFFINRTEDIGFDVLRFEMRFNIGLDR